jgi:peroxidase
MVGETFAAVLVDQFTRLRDGDPFWSQNSDLPPAELEALWSTTLSDIIERNTDIGTMQDNAFLAYDRVGGGEGGDRLTGADGRDLLIGLGGRDRLTGEAGDDQLAGGAGADKLNGGAGNDILEGGEGRDVFMINAGNGNDVITDFSSGDVVQLSGVGVRRFRDLDLTETDKGVVLTLRDGGTVTFEGLSEDDLDRDNFLLTA